MEAHNEAGPLAFRWRQEDDFWELTVYLTPVELVGGAVDGAVVYPAFSLDVQGLCSAFEELAAIRWNAHAFAPHDWTGPHISIEGVYRGHHVYLQVLSDPPEDEEPGLKVDWSGRTETP